MNLKITSQQSSQKVQASEVTYELHSLGWKAFQNLCVTIIADVMGQVVESFFDSKDGGRDGAFHGTWKPEKGESFQGSFTVQCKFTAKPSKFLQLSDLKDELIKASPLASRGLADNYILFTNLGITGATEVKIRQKFLSVPGIKQFGLFGRERISQIIRESPRLRMLVPRVYGLGDLSQILDQRAYDQAQEILSALGDDLSKFVITDAYRKSAKAMADHGFVILLGEPACGKSTIAAALSLGALDEWGCSTIKVRDADEFVTHSNPHEPKQFFWVDDAFGTTQLDWGNASAWNRVFPHLQAAIHRGARIVFTSRDYIYNLARHQLKVSSFPLIDESQVVIRVNELSKKEKEQILYNHIRMGSQPQEFKTRIKPILYEVSDHQLFSPEIARRLGNPIFTKKLVLSKVGLDDFVGRPLELLCDVIRTLDAECWSAIALVFMHGGSLQSPVEMTNEDQQAVKQLGGSDGGVRNALNSLNGSLLIKTFQNGSYVWRYKHPTIRDAFATLIAEDTELMNIYLIGTPIEKILEEVTCGDVGIQGVKVIVPNVHFETIIGRIKKLYLAKQDSRRKTHWFLAHRCNQEFLSLYLTHFPELIPSLRVVSYLDSGSDVDVIASLNKFSLFPEENRIEVVAKISEIAIKTPDSGFLKERFRPIFKEGELESVLEHVRTTLLPNLEDLIENWRSDYLRYNSEIDPEVYFDELVSALKDYRDEFMEYGESIDQIDSALAQIDQVIEDIISDRPEPPEYDDDYRMSSTSNLSEITRSIFDDVDL